MTEETYTTEERIEQIPEKQDASFVEDDCTDIVDVTVEPLEVQRKVSPLGVLVATAAIGTAAAFAWKKTKSFRENLKAQHDAKKIGKAIKLLQDNGVNVDSGAIWSRTSPTEIVDDSTSEETN